MAKSGFTLIELLIVIAIIAILAAIALIPYTYYMRKAQAKELLTFARECAQELVAQCASEGSVNTSKADSCNPDIVGSKTKYITGLTIKAGSPDCTNNQITSLEVTAEGSVGGKIYQVVCSYDSTNKDITCTTPTMIQ